MSHDTNHGHTQENTTIISFKNSFWLVVVLVGLFIAAINFIQVESAGGEEGHGGHEAATHEAHGGAEHGAAAHGHAEPGSAVKHADANEAAPEQAHEEHAPAAEHEAAH